MLNVALGKLSCGRAQKMLPCQPRLRQAERHAILQLIAEAISAAGLVKARASPQSANDRLIQKPAVQQNIHRTIGRPHLDRAQRMVPVLGHIAENLVEVGCTISLDQRQGFRSASPPRPTKM